MFSRTKRAHTNAVQVMQIFEAIHFMYVQMLMDIDDYRQYQIEMQRIAGEYEIPFDEEIKWSDLRRKMKRKA